MWVYELVFFVTLCENKNTGNAKVRVTETFVGTQAVAIKIQGIVQSWPSPRTWDLLTFGGRKGMGFPRGRGLHGQCSCGFPLNQTNTGLLKGDSSTHLASRGLVGGFGAGRTLCSEPFPTALAGFPCQLRTGLLKDRVGWELGATRTSKNNSNCNK